MLRTDAAPTRGRDRCLDHGPEVLQRGGGNTYRELREDIQHRTTGRQRFSREIRIVTDQWVQQQPPEQGGSEFFAGKLAGSREFGDAVRQKRELRACVRTSEAARELGPRVRRTSEIATLIFTTHEKSEV